ncbi:MAG: LamG-like jellyroll fold domain-containing protein [Verrucomicrobiota bacterium]
MSEWKFEGNLNDTSGHNNHGTAAGGVEYVAGVSGSAVRLAAGNPIVNDAAQGLPSGGADSWSINLWLRLASAPTSLAYLAGFGPVNDTGAGTARGLIAYGGTQNNSVSVWGSNADTISSTPYPLNRWAMVTITYDGADGTTSLYLDGQLIAQNVQRRVLIPDGEFHVSLAPTSYWHIDTAGDFDEFTIWSGVLGPSQISALNNVARPKLDVKLAGTTLTLSWPAAATGFVLETTDDMGQGVWNVVQG